MKISLIIPTLNEENTIGQTLAQVCSPEMGLFEVLIVDGGSSDQTKKICAHYPCHFLNSPKKGRGAQMNWGAKHAKGEVLLFLHADTLLPKNARIVIENALVSPKVCSGGFSKVFDQKHFLSNGGISRSKFRYKWLGIIAGDQGLFVRKEIFQKAGGYPEIEVMEEFYLCKKLRTLGKMVLLPEYVVTSARRFFDRGIIRCYLRMYLVGILFYFRFPPRLLERVYYSD